MKIGILREEGRTPPEKRSPLNPQQCVLIQQKYPNVKVIVQPSPHRCFDDDEFVSLGITLQEDLSECEILFGIKEVPIHNLLDSKTYFFFSHTLKKQVHNRKLLQTVLQRNITLVDYECIVDESGNRLIAFGFFAGIVGAYNGIKTYGHRHNLFELPPAYSLKSISHLEEELVKIKLPTLKIALTGGGRVAQGAMHILSLLKIKQVTPHDYISNKFDYAVFTQLNSSDYHRHKDNLFFDRDDFHHNPQNYISTFLPFAFATDILIAGAFWHPEAPMLFSKNDMLLSEFNIQVIADITCDIGGSIPSTVKSSTISDPVYDYDKFKGTIHPPYSDKNHITVMAVDNLPCELPRDASSYFGDRLIQNVFPDLFSRMNIVNYATIASNGKLMSRFAYLQDFVEE